MLGLLEVVVVVQDALEGSAVRFVVAPHLVFPAANRLSLVNRGLIEA
jgi:hypothetical protein